MFSSVFRLERLSRAALCAAVLAGASGCVTTVEERLADGTIKVSRYYPWNSPQKNSSKPSSTLSLAYGQLMEQQGHGTEARGWYEETLKRNPRSVDAIVGLARLDSQAGRTEEARKRLNEAEKMDPKSATVQAAIAQFHADRKEFPEAMSRFQQALATAPDNQSIRTQYAQALAHSGSYDQAYAQFAQAVGEPAAHYNLGLIYYEEQRLALAEDQFTQALAKNPKLTQAQTWLDSVRKEQEQVARGRGIPSRQNGAIAQQRRAFTPNNTSAGGPVISAAAPGVPASGIASPGITTPGVSAPGVAAVGYSAGPATNGYQVAPAGGLPASATHAAGGFPTSAAVVPSGRQVIHAPSVPTGSAPAVPAAADSAIPQPPPGLTPAQLEQWNNQFRTP